jgi:hypothetical protein
VLKRTQEAFDELLPVAGTFPKVWTIPYNLSMKQKKQKGVLESVG